MLQFRNYNRASHERFLHQGMQERWAQFTSAMVRMTSVEPLSACLCGERYERFTEVAKDSGRRLA
ncbi:hypothetical protein ACLBWH_00250 [Sphingomonas sp. M6A6_1c]